VKSRKAISLGPKHYSTGALVFPIALGSILSNGTLIFALAEALTSVAPTSVVPRL
jgi:hypothetical protein